MRKTAFAALLVAAALLLAGAVQAQMQRRVVALPQPGLAAPGVAAPAPGVAAPAPGVAQQPVAPPPKPPSITVENGKLSVDLVNAPLGNVLHEIGTQMNFSVEIAGGASGNLVSTKFTNVDVLRGIERLLSLAQANNYLFRYDTEGNLSKIELYAPSSVMASSSSMLPSAQNNADEDMPVHGKRRYRRYIPPTQPVPMPVPGQP